MSDISENEVDLAIDSLCETDRQLLLGECSGWGSWMMASGGYMVSLGLGTKSNGSIAFDTPLAAAVIARLRNTRAKEPSDDQ